MRVLWFVNKPLPAVCEALGLPENHRGGWLDALEVILRGSDIELAVASATPTAAHPFVAFGTKYYSMPRSTDSNSFVNRAVRALEERSYIWPSMSKCDAVVKDFAPDLIHVHGTEGPFGLGLPRWRAHGVISIQGILSSLSQLEKRGLDRDAWLSMSPRLFARGEGMGHATKTLKRMAKRERAIVARCDNFMGRTRFDHDFVLAVRPSAKYYHCDELLRQPFMSTKWQQRPTEPRVIICSGGNYARKGLGTALDALAILLQAGHDDVVLRFLGAIGGDESRRALLRHSRRLGIAKHVQETGSVDGTQTATELAMASVYILPTHCDNSPNSLCEAMAVGVPIVASSAGGIPSLAADDREALLVQDGDPYALAGAIHRVLADQPLGHRLAESARRTALARHNPRRVSGQILDAYTAIAKGAMNIHSPNLVALDSD